MSSGDHKHVELEVLVYLHRLFSNGSTTRGANQHTRTIERLMEIELQKLGELED